MLLDEKNKAMLMGQKVFREAELNSRYEIQLENYCKSVRIEALTMTLIARRLILPALSSFTAQLANATASKTRLDSALVCGYERALVRKLDRLTDQIDLAAGELSDLTKRFDTMEDITQEGAFIRDQILPAMAKLRGFCDEAEVRTESKAWPLPSYGKLLYGVD
jgi:glutamine synthetase